MRFAQLVLVLLFVVVSVYAQSDLSALVKTEQSFAMRALEKGTRSAFLEFMSGDALIFVPDRTSAKSYWTARPESPAALIWAPNSGDISSNGILGYTTGNWEFRAKGRSDEPSAYGNFVTVWLRQPTGNYRWVIDIGVSHSKPAAFSNEFKPAEYPSRGNPRGISAADSANRFYEMTARDGIEKAYSAFADENVRFFREGDMPGTGKKALQSLVKKHRSNITFPKRSVFFESDDLAYVNNSYRSTTASGKIESGNFLQIWKLIDGKWKIVLDIFKPVPQVSN